MHLKQRKVQSWTFSVRSNPTRARSPPTTTRSSRRRSRLSCGRASRTSASSPSARDFLRSWPRWSCTSVWPNPMPRRPRFCPTRSSSCSTTRSPSTSMDLSRSSSSQDSSRRSTISWRSVSSGARTSLPRRSTTPSSSMPGSTSRPRSPMRTPRRTGG